VSSSSRTNPSIRATPSPLLRATCSAWIVSPLRSSVPFSASWRTPRAGKLAVPSRTVTRPVSSGSSQVPVIPKSAWSTPPSSRAAGIVPSNDARSTSSATARTRTSPGSRRSATSAIARLTGSSTSMSSILSPRRTSWRSPVRRSSRYSATIRVYGGWKSPNLPSARLPSSRKMGARPVPARRNVPLSSPPTISWFRCSSSQTSLTGSASRAPVSSPGPPNASRPFTAT
jgi:hypothetical protein